MATTIKAHKIRLNPTPEQEDYLRRAVGTRRFIYNWGLDQWQKQYAAYNAERTAVPEGQRRLKSPSALDLKKQFNAIREAQFPWTYNVTKCVVEGAFDDLDNAFATSLPNERTIPRWKKKSKSRESFYIANDKFTVGDHWVQVPVLGDFIVRSREASGQPIPKRMQMKRALGKINMSEKLRFTGKIIGATISTRAGFWFISIQVEVQTIVIPVEGPPVGIDVGFMRLATLSDDTRFENQKPLRHLLQQVRYLSKQLARRKKGSKNREKTKRRLARLHYRIACLRDDILHKISHEVAEHYSFIGLEDLNLQGMLKNHKRALSASDASLGKLARYIKTKARAHGTVVQKVGRFFPSTKRCHQCHQVREITESERVYVCHNSACGWVGDRDLNAALNILEEALRLAGRALANPA